VRGKKEKKGGEKKSVEFGGDLGNKIRF